MQVEIKKPKYQGTSVILEAGASFDPDGTNLTYNWISPDGETFQEESIIVIDQNPSSRYTKYKYVLQVMDDENAISTDSVDVIFSYFSAPESPNIMPLPVMAGSYFLGCFFRNSL